MGLEIRVQRIWRRIDLLSNGVIAGLAMRRDLLLYVERLLHDLLEIAWRWSASI